MKKIITFMLIFSGFYLYSFEKVIDSSGNLYQICQNSKENINKLQIYIYHSNGNKTLLDVPTTEDSVIENYPNIIYLESSKMLIILYSKEREDGSDLIIQTMDDKFNFSPPYKISEGTPLSYCINPKIYRTYNIRISDNFMEITQFLHLIWWQRGSLEGAVYANIPLIFNNLDIESKTLIYLNDYISLNDKNYDSSISNYLYESPEIFIPKANENKLSVLFADLDSLSYVILDLNYDDGDTLRDRAHFPDIGVKTMLDMPISLSPSSNVDFILSENENIALMYKNAEGNYEFSYYCSGWSQVAQIPLINNYYEAREFVKRIIEEPKY